MIRKGIQHGRHGHRIADALLPLFFLSLIVPFSTKAQPAGMNTLSVLDMSHSARSAGLGMDYLSIFDADLMSCTENPSLISPAVNHVGALNGQWVVGGAQHYSIVYGHSFSRFGTIVASLRGYNYGTFDEYSAEDDYQGHFTAADYVLSLGWGTMLNEHFSVGVSFKPVLSQYESYTALAVAFDLATSYFSSDRQFAATLIGRNAGAQLVTFDGTSEPLPFELSAEVSYKLARAPFRVFLTATELQRWNLRFEDPLNPTSHTDPFTGEVTRQSWVASTADNLMRHLQVGVELTLGKSLYARVGYNYRQNAEMRGLDVFNLSGFAFGLGIRTKRFELHFARRNYHLTQAPTFLSLSYNF